MTYNSKTLNMKTSFIIIFILLSSCGFRSFNSDTEDSRPLKSKVDVENLKAIQRSDIASLVVLKPGISKTWIVENNTDFTIDEIRVKYWQNNETVYSNIFYMKSNSIKDLLIQVYNNRKEPEIVYIKSAGLDIY